jgi:hypothetical protein
MSILFLLDKNKINKPRQNLGLSIKNVKVKYIRSEGYNNLKDWMEDDNNVYIGRAGIVFIDGVRYPKEASIFCNPYKIDRDGTIDEILEKFRVYINNKLKKTQML